MAGGEEGRVQRRSLRACAPGAGEGAVLQVDATFGAGATSSPAGRLSESETLVSPAVLSVLTKVSDSRDVWPSETAVGEKVLQSLRPEQQVVGVVHRELINLMGPVDHSLHLKPGTTVLMLCGLQGSGKTTTCGKLGRMIKERGGVQISSPGDLYPAMNARRSIG